MSPNPYDVVPYKSHPFSQSHPDRLATIGTLFGLNPAPIDGCRVLELGCASGGNLLPMADQFPGSRFVGIDASSRQIEQGNELLADGGLVNVELKCQDILDFDSEHTFDYIICHGVYSWVPPQVQQKILEICQRFLMPHGIAYISYNTYPGWHMRGMIREIMQYRAQSFIEPRQKLNQARGLLTFLSNSVKSEKNPYGLLLNQELDIVCRKDDSYLLHEYLEEVNDPVYFHEFIQRATDTRLQYLGEAQYGVMSVENFPQVVRDMLQGVSRDMIELEQYMDFLRNRAFRQTLLCHADAPLKRSAQHENLVHLRVASNARPETVVESVSSKDAVVYRRAGSKVTSSDPLVKAAMKHLLHEWPDSIPFVELASIAQSLATGRPSMIDSDFLGRGSEPLAITLLRCFATSTVDLRRTSAPFVKEVTDYPAASTLTRLQAMRGPDVTNRLHESVSLNDTERQVLACCDGQSNVKALIERMADKVVSGELIQHHEGRRITDRETTVRLAAESVPGILKALCERAFFVS